MTWNSIPVALDEKRKDVVFVYAGEGGAKLTLGDNRTVRFHMVAVGGEKFDGGVEYLDYKQGNYYDCYAHVNLRDDDGDFIAINSDRIDNQDFFLKIAGGTGKWAGVSGQLKAKLTFVETRKTPGMNPATHFWCVYALEGDGEISLQSDS